MLAALVPSDKASLRAVDGFHAGLVAFGAAGLIEAATVAARSASSLAGPMDAALAFVATFALTASAGLVAGVLLAVLGTPLFRAALDELARASSDRARAIALGARALGSAIASLAPIALVFAAGRAAHGFARADLAARFLALACAAGLAVGAGAYPALRGLAQSALNRAVPRHTRGPVVVAVVLIAIAGSAGALVLSATSSADLGAMRLDGVWELAGASMGALVLLAVARSRGWQPPRWQAVALLVVVGASVVTASVSLSRSHALAGAIVTHGSLARLDLLALRAALDLDGDGYSAALAGGDCDDGDASRHPDATEVPGNGIDENCEGGDGRADPADVEHGRATPSGRPPRRDSVVLILLDSLRPDHLGTFGYARSTSPNLDAFAASACVFENARAQAPNTPRSFPSILTGRYPSRLRWVDREASFSDLAPGQPTLFDAFRAAGYRTEAVTAHPYFARVPELRSGVDAWDDPFAMSIEESMTATTAPDVTDRSIARLDALYAAERPFVLFVHYSEPHSRYVAHDGVPPFGEEPLDRYDGEIAFLDRHVARLLAAVSSEERSARTTVVVLADHGEAFEEHGLGLHGRTVFEEEIRVPLLVRAPGIAPCRTDAPVALIDVLPTLAELAGVEAPLAQGRSLVPELLGRTGPPDRVVFLEQLPYASYRIHMVAAQHGALKVVRDLTNGVTFGFDLAADPHEQANRIEHEPARFAELLAQLTAFVDATP